jgi:hypothetical protein
MNRIAWTSAWVLLSAGLCLAQQTFYFPQVADGFDPPGTNSHWHTTIFLSNQGSTAVASGTVTLFQSNGSPMNISFVDDRGQAAASGNQITFQIPPGQSRKYTSVSSGNLQVGYAVVTANAPIAGNAMFSHWTNPPNEQLIAEAAVPAASLLIKQAVFADTQFGFNTGFALANPSSSSIVVTFQLVDTDGQIVATATQTLAPGQHMARFVTEIFGSVAPMAGRLQITANTGSLAAMALRFDSRFERFTTMFPFTVP